MHALQDRRSILRTRVAKLMEARTPDLAEAPGGSTGLLIRCGSPALPVYKSGHRATGSTHRAQADSAKHTHQAPRHRRSGCELDGWNSEGAFGVRPCRLCERPLWSTTQMLSYGIWPLPEGIVTLSVGAVGNPQSPSLAPLLTRHVGALVGRRPIAPARPFFASPASRKLSCARRTNRCCAPDARS